MALDLGNLTAGIEVDASRAIATLTDFERKVGDTSQALDGLDRKKVNVAPAGKRELDAASQSAQGLERGLDKASAAAGKIKTPTGVAGGLDKAAGSAAGLADELDRAGREAAELAQSSGPSALDGALGGLAGTIKGLLPQITAVATAGTVLSKGWGRLTGIDNATSKLGGLGHASEDVAAIMDSALTSVNGTAFGLADAANAAASAVASGVKPGTELTQVLTTMADTAAFSGTSMQDMGMIFNSVMVKGKLQGDDLMQLMGRSIPVLQMIGDQLGITAAEASQMATDGLISFEIFEKAMREGLGGSALAMGETVEGALQNVGAAAGRLGAAIMEPLMNEGPAAIAGFTEGINVLTDAVNAAYGAWDKVPGALKIVIASLAAAKAAQMLLNTEMAKGLALRISDGYASASKGIGDFASSLGEAYRNTRLANPEMGALSSGLTVLAGSGGVASTAMGGLKNAAGGLLTALGGPWGLAIGGATVALGLFMKHVADTKQAQQEAEAATQAWADTLAQADGAITEQVQQHAIAQVQALDLTETYTKLGYTTADVAAAVLDLDDSYGPLIAHLDEVIRAGTDTTSIQAQMSARGFIMDGAAQEAKELKDELLELNGQYLEGAAAAEDNADATNELSMKVADLHRNADDAAGGMDPLLGVFEAMGAEAKTVDDAIKNLANAMLRLSDDPSLRLQSYLSSAAQDLQKFGESLSGGMGGFDVETGHFDVWTEQGQVLHGTLSNLRTSMYEVAAAQYRLNKDMGVAGPEAASMAAEAANELTSRLEAQLLAAGWTEEQVASLIERYEMVPGDIMTHVQAAGVETATDLINGLDERLVHIDQERYTITVDADAIAITEEQAKELGYTWEDIGNNQIQLTADDEQARHAIEDLAEKTEHLNTQDNTIVLRGDHKDVVDSLNEVDGMAAELQTRPATLPVVADTEKARAGIEQLELEATELPDGTLFVHTNSEEETQKLLNLGAETVALPEGYIEITDTSAENIRALQTLGVEVKTLPDGRVVITDNSAKIRDDINRNLSRRVLDRAGTVTMNIIENVRRVFSRSTGGSIPERAEGGSIPKLAAGDRTHGGYRLPMSGPGTERTDGILGLDWRGIPTAWVDRGEWVTNRDASQKYNATLTGINLDDPALILAGLARELPALESGGRTAAQVKSELSQIGTPYIFGGWSTEGVDCSGAVSAAANIYDGRPMLSERAHTGNMGEFLAARGFVDGLGGPGTVSVGWKHGGPGGGHTAMTLEDGTNVESGGNTGQGLTIGGKAAGADDPYFDQHMHLPLMDQAGWAGGSGGVSDITGLTGGGRVSASAEDRQRWHAQAGFDAMGATAWANAATGINALISQHQGTLNALGLNPQMMPEEMPEIDLTPIREFSDLLVEAMPVVTLLNEVGGEGLSGLGHMVEAHQKLIAAQEAVTDNTYDIAAAQEAVEEARLAEKRAQEELAELSEGSTEVSVSNARKIADAEEAVVKARESGKADKIADAEKRLARAREDVEAQLSKDEKKRAKDLEKAHSNVSKATKNRVQAEANLADVSGQTAGMLRDVTAAQFGMAASAVQAFAEIGGAVAGSLSEMWDAQAAGWAMVKDMALEVEELRHQLALDELDVAKLAVRRVSALRELRKAEAARDRVALETQTKLKKATDAAGRSMGGTIKVGENGIRQLADAQRNYERTGVWAMETITIASDDATQAQISGIQSVMGQEHELQAIQHQGYLDEIAAHEQVRLAQLAVAEATYQQHVAAQLLALSTEKARIQAEHLYGITSAAATALEQEAQGKAEQGEGWRNVAEGAGIVAAGAATGFALGGPAGALAGGLIALIPGGAKMLEGGSKIATGKQREDAYREAAAEERSNIDPEKLREIDTAGALGFLASFGGADGSRVASTPFDEMRIKSDAAVLQLDAQIEALEKDRQLMTSEFELQRMLIQEEAAQQAEVFEFLKQSEEDRAAMAGESLAVQQAYLALAEGAQERALESLKSQDLTVSELESIRHSVEGLATDSARRLAELEARPTRVDIVVEPGVYSDGDVVRILNDLTSRVAGLEGGAVVSDRPTAVASVQSQTR